MQCIGEAFGVDPNDAAQYERLTIKPATLQSLFDVYLKTTAKMKSGPSSPSVPPSTSTKSGAPTSVDRAGADALKSRGNTFMSAKKYEEAIEAYTEATKLDPTNPVYFSNRAAAYSSIDDHDSAIEDAKKAAELDPTFVKAYSRLGCVPIPFTMDLFL